MSDFRFAEIGMVHAMWGVLAFVVLLLALDHRIGDALGRFLSRHMQSRLVVRPSVGRRRLRILVLGLSGVFLVLALMRPQWGLRYEETPRAGAEIMICLDVSRSMLAEDVIPNRMERAKAEIVDLLPMLNGDHVGLIAFAGYASVVCPLTPDFGFLRLVLDGVGIHTVRRGGSRLGEALQKAVDGFGDTSDVSRAIILITDGEDHDSFPEDAARSARERGIKMITIGFGDEGGSEIPYTDPETGARTLVRDAAGNVVKSRLDGDTLRAISEGGVYIPAKTGVLDLESIYDSHIAPLTRGTLDGRGREVRNDAFQWAVLLGLVALFASCMLQGGGSTGNPTRRAGSAGASAMMVAATLFLLAPPLHAQSPQDPTGSGTGTPIKGALPGDGETEKSTTTTGTDGVDEEAEPARSIPEDPRAAYNRGLELFNIGELDSAEEHLLAGRQNFGTDAEVRYYSTYNLGWVEVKRADTNLQEKPKDALKALYSAADWFRDAVRLRPGDQRPRRNLELVQRRAVELADAIAKQDEKDLAASLDEAMKAQRELIGRAASMVSEVAALADTNDIDGFRREFRGLASEQRQVLSDTGHLVDRVGEEADTIAEKSEEERTPEDQIRAVQLQGVLAYLHRAREKMGQSRAQLKRRQGERGFRRASAALRELARARDQLRDPVDFLRALAGDAHESFTLTQLFAETRVPPDEGSALPPVEPPAWLTAEFLQETQGSVTQRSEEIHLRLDAGVKQMESQDVADTSETDTNASEVQPPDPQREKFLETVREALPHLLVAKEAFRKADEHLGQVTPDLAAPKQAEGISAIAEALELFLDLKGLIERVYATERRIRAGFDQTLAMEPEQLEQALLPLLRVEHEKNLKRCDRLSAMLDDELAALPAEGAPPPPPGTPSQGDEAEAQKMERQRLTLAKQLLDSARVELSTVQSALGDPSAVPPRAFSNDEAVVAADRGLEQLEALRRLFFSIVEHLRDTARSQQELNDETQDVAGIAAAKPEEASRIGPLQPRQEELARISLEIGGALEEQSKQAPASAAGATPGANPGGAEAAEEASKRLARAAELVYAAEGEMQNAVAGMVRVTNEDSAAVPTTAANATGADPDQQDVEDDALGAVRKNQNTALQQLLEALSLLVPPEQQQQEQQQQQQQDQQEQEEQQNMSAEQLLQAVRDREAKRRQQRDKKQRRQDPVEKDW